MAANPPAQDELIDFGAMFDALPTPYVVLKPDLTIVEANAAFLQSTERSRRELLGRSLFEAFPPPPDELAADGISPVQQALIRVRDTGRTETLPIQRYPILDGHGETSERFWLLVAAAVLDGQGRTTLLVQRAEDITAFIKQHGQPVQAGDQWLQSTEPLEADVASRAHEVAEAFAARDVAVERLSRLAEVALALTAAQTVEDLERIVVAQGLRVLGADGGAVISQAVDGAWRVSVNASPGERLQVGDGSIGYDSPLPAAWTARTGERLLLPTRASGLAFDTAMQAVYENTERAAWGFFPLSIQGEQLGSLAVAWIDEHVFRPDELALLDGFAAQCSQALHRIRTADAQREATAHAQKLAETLQQALLTPPPEPDHLHIVARYRPAAEQAQVGGDWYDAFMQPDGATMLVIGDVMGHDIKAAAQMGQLRGLLRALAFSGEEIDAVNTPADILSQVEHTARGLAVETFASLILARIERIPEVAVTGTTRTLRWSNAGHPPPVLLQVDGTSTLLEADPDLMFGVDPNTRRRDNTFQLPDGSTLLMFTDGLIERRDASLDEGLDLLRKALADLGSAPVDELCDTVLARLAPHTGDDDIALLAVRAYPEDRLRPAEAGPNWLPAGQSD